MAEPDRDSSVRRIQGRLTRLAERARETSQRSSRVSRRAWWFIFALSGGEGLYLVLGLLFPMIRTTVVNGGTTTTYSSPYWAIPVAFAPAVVLLVLALREIYRGFAPLATADSDRVGARTSGVEEVNLGWTELVRLSQEELTHSKHEMEISFIPLVLGFLGGAELASFGIAQLLPTAYQTPLFFVLAPIGAVPFILGILWPLYQRVRSSLRVLQSELERHVGGLTQLESEFLDRFGGFAATG